jgi:hypothetical protein
MVASPTSYSWARSAMVSPARVPLGDLSTGDFQCTPINGHSPSQSVCLKGANSGHIARALVSPIRWYYTLSHSAHNSLGVGPETA